MHSHLLLIQSQQQKIRPSQHQSYLPHLSQKPAGQFSGHSLYTRLRLDKKAEDPIR